MARAFRIAHDETGASAVEYGLIMFAIAAVIAATAFAFGGAVLGLFGNSCDTFAAKAAENGTSACTRS